MMLLRRILNRLNVLIVEYRDGECYCLRFARATCLRRGVELGVWDDVAKPESIGRELAGIPLMVIITGYGVICKSDHEAVVLKIKNDESGFLWNESGGNISFVRRSQTDRLFAGLTELNAKIVANYCMAGALLGEDSVKAAVEAYFSSLSLKVVLRPDSCGDSLAKSLVGKFKFYVLGILFALLLANAVISPGVRIHYEAIKKEANALRMQAGASDAVYRKRADVFSEFKKIADVPIAVICDRIAVALPYGISLTSLVVSPPVKKIEKDKLPEFEKGVVTVCGNALNSGQISEYILALERLSMFSVVKLSGVEYDKDRRVYSFSIRIEP